jgi:hypothetical protein
MPNAQTSLTSIEEIMSDTKFGLGVADARSGRGHHSAFDNWTGNEQWNYERGRQWATLVPRIILLKRAGRLTPEAIHWFERVGTDIL